MKPIRNDKFLLINAILTLAAGSVSPNIYLKIILWVLGAIELIVAYNFYKYFKSLKQWKH